MEKYQALVSHLTDIHYLSRGMGLIEWDMQVNMPPKAAAERGAMMASLSRLRHEMFTGEKTATLLAQAADEVKGMEYDSDEASMVRVVMQDYEQQTRLPAHWVSEWAQVTTEAQGIWAQARANNDFKAFLPTLERIMELARQSADYLGYQEHPYDALLGQFERGITAAQVKTIFDGHKPQLVELIAAIRKNSHRASSDLLHQPLDIEKQRQFGLWAAKSIGFDFERGRQDISVHPFASGIARTDVRLTTRFYPDFFNPAFFGLMHEAGHGMYEQGSGANLEGTPLSGGGSLGIHESQSRMWENLVGRSRNFWKWALPKLKETFPQQFGSVDLETFYRAINTVKPSYIRVEADEATYNLHIMLRFELEMALIKGDIQMANLPREWNDRFEAYLGITPPSDAMGVLQDVHWSAGLIGYFPTYALGNLLSSQFYNCALTDHPEIPDEIAEGRFDKLLTWLNRNIHQHGRKFTMDELVRRVTGEPINASAYIHYLQHKYSDIYDL
jgi:carboxypeptidase Taq